MASKKKPQPSPCERSSSSRRLGRGQPSGSVARGHRSIPGNSSIQPSPGCSSIRQRTLEETLVERRYVRAKPVQAPPDPPSFRQRTLEETFRFCVKHNLIQETDSEMSESDEEEGGPSIPAAPEAEPQAGCSQTPVTQQPASSDESLPCGQKRAAPASPAPLLKSSSDESLPCGQKRAPLLKSERKPRKAAMAAENAWRRNKEDSDEGNATSESSEVGSDWVLSLASGKLLNIYF